MEPQAYIILVTLTGTLVFITLAAIISIVLSPGHISFTIENSTSGKADEEDTKRYNFTLAANNTNPHMAALYGALSAEIWYTETAWVQAVVNRSSLQDGTTRQKPTYINVSAEYWQSEQPSTPPPPSASTTGGGGSAPITTETDWSNCTVLVTATVWFKYGWISTRSYDVLANCSPVNFNGTGGGSVACQQG